MRGEDRQDQLTAIDNGDLQLFFEVSQLTRRQVVVEDDHVWLQLLDQRLQLLHFAFAEQGGLIEVIAVLSQAAENLDASGFRQASEFFQRFRLKIPIFGEQDGDDDRPLTGDKKLRAFGIVRQFIKARAQGME